MPPETVRVGIIGAGGNTRLRHVPGFRGIPGVELLGVVNRTPESTARAAAEFGIPRTYARWQDLIADPEIDAVLIGTWPYLHCEATLAALDARKHVLTEARMACNAAEAHQMLESARKHPDLVKQIVPSPIGLAQHPYVLKLLADGFLGELRELVVIAANDAWRDASRPLHWRQDRRLSGFNMLQLGIVHESAMRWTPATTRVFAQTTIFEPQRPALDGNGLTDVTVPDSVQVLTELENGARGLYHISGVTLHGPGSQIHLYGSRGTIKLEASPRERLLIGGPNDGFLDEVHVPHDQHGGWRVEEEFIAAIRGSDGVHFTDFVTGVKYMEFTEAVARSAETGLPVSLPLPEFAHVHDT